MRFNALLPIAITGILLLSGCARSTKPVINIETFSESMRYISKADVYVDELLFGQANSCLSTPYPSIEAFGFTFSTTEEQNMDVTRRIADQGADCLAQVAQISSVGREIDSKEGVKITCRVAVDQEGRVVALKQLSGPRRTVSVLPCFANYRYRKTDETTCISTDLLTMQVEMGM